MVKDDDLVERVGEGETLTKNPEKAFLRHLVNEPSSNIDTKV